MRRIHPEYSANPEEVLGMERLCEVIRAEPNQTAAFPMPDGRVRAIRVDHCAVADGSHQHGFVNLSASLREGRTDGEKQIANRRIIDPAKRLPAPAMTTHYVALTSETRDIHADPLPKYKNIRDYLEDAA